MTASARRLGHDEAEELLGACALDALEPDEAALVEAHLADCPRCAGEVARHHEVAALLANTGADAPAELWDRIAERLGAPGSTNWERLAARLEHPAGIEDLIEEGDETRTTASPAEPDSPAAVWAHRRRLRRGFATQAATVIATAAAVLAVVFGVQVSHLDNQVAQLQTAANRAGLTYAAQVALVDPTTKQAMLVPAGPPSPGGPSVTVAIIPSGTAYLIPRNLASLPPGQTYQLWGEIGDKMISFGLIGAHPTISAFTVEPGMPVSSFAITAEPAGGVVQPTRPPLVQGSVAT